MEILDQTNQEKLVTLEKSPVIASSILDKRRSIENKIRLLPLTEMQSIMPETKIAIASP